MKICTKCNQMKDLSEYYRMVGGKDGLRADCKECKLAGDKDRYQLNRTEILDRQNSYYYNNRAARLSYNQINKERIRKVRLESVQQRKHHAEYESMRRALIASVSIEDIVRDVVYERDNGICYLCEKPTDPNNWHLEHKIPLSRGGSHTYNNVAVSHPPCNKNKGTMTPDEFFARVHGTIG